MWVLGQWPVGPPRGSTIAKANEEFVKVSNRQSFGQSKQLIAVPRTGHRCPNMFRGADGGVERDGISLPLVRRLLTEVGVMVTDL
jgi:hypothetical protein